MLAYFILGIGLFVAMLLMANWYASADAKSVLKFLKWALIFGFSGAGLFFLFTGRLAWAFMALPALLPWFFRLRLVLRAAKAFSRMSGTFRSSGQTSDVETTILRMALDHDTGEMSGEVLKGKFVGRQIDDLNESELVELLGVCQVDDQDAARVLETYLDRHHPSWRSVNPGADERQKHSAFSNDMELVEAYKVLGLDEGASVDNIKDAHRRLIAGLHPDHGGSDYLAAKINQAKDLLLKG